MDDKNKNNYENIDRRKLTPEQVGQLDQYIATQKQISELKHVADVLEQLVISLENAQDDNNDNAKKTGALLADMHKQLGLLNDKEAPESPEVAEPVVAAVEKLEAALAASIKAIDVKPNIKLPAPNVTVNAPEVNVDLTEVKDVLKNEVPKAFKAAIAAMPKIESSETDLQPLFNQLQEMSIQLESIDTASRLKPQFPVKQLNDIRDSLTVLNGYSRATDSYGIQAISNDGTYKYFFFENDSGFWYVMRKNLLTKVFDYARGVTNNGYQSVYQSSILGPSGTPTWASRGATF